MTDGLTYELLVWVYKRTRADEKREKKEVKGKGSIREKGDIVEMCWRKKMRKRIFIKLEFKWRRERSVVL